MSGKAKKSAKGKAKKFLKKKMNEVKEVFETMKSQVIEAHGFMYRIETKEQFEACLRSCDNEHVLKLKKELDDAEGRITSDQDEIKTNGLLNHGHRLTITLDDDILHDNKDLYI